MKKVKTLKLKGLRTPRPFIFIHGFTDGRTKTAALDPQDGHLNSAYIHGHIYLFHELCKKRVIQLEKELSGIRAEAQTLIKELKNIKLPPECNMPEVDRPDSQRPATIAASRFSRAAAAEADKVEKANARLKTKRENILARREWIIHRLIKIREQISLSERICIEEMEATSNALKNCYCTYGHGALLKPVHPAYIPAVAYDGYLDAYFNAHNELSQKITDILNKEEDNHV